VAHVSHFEWDDKSKRRQLLLTDKLAELGVVVDGTFSRAGDHSDDPGLRP